jgi:hypothetical protein
MVAKAQDYSIINCTLPRMAKRLVPAVKGRPRGLLEARVGFRKLGRTGRNCVVRLPNATCGFLIRVT